MSKEANPRIEKQLLEGLIKSLERVGADLMRVHAGASVLMEEEDGPISETIKQYYHRLHNISFEASDLSGRAEELKKSIQTVVNAYEK